MRAKSAASARAPACGSGCGTGPAIAAARRFAVVAAASRSAVVGAALLLAACSSLSDGAAGSEEAAPSDAANAPARFVLPDVIPRPGSFESLVGFVNDGQSGMRFAVDPNSFLPGDRQAQITIAARSPSGVINLGYYGFDCEDLRYQMLAYGAGDGRWQPARRPTWREVRDGESRNRQFRAVFGAVCQLGGRATQTTDEMLARLSDPRHNLYLTP
ncbi:MAG: CNP1-like family protein [Burkholderiaceae bacterium]